MKLFETKIKHIDHIVELPAGTKLPELTGDLRESLKSLSLHPGFAYLLQRQRYQCAGVQNALKEGMNLTETQIRFLQAGLYWLSFIEKDLNSLTQTIKPERPAQEDERALFNRVRESLDLVGVEE